MFSSNYYLDFLLTMAALVLPFLVYLLSKRRSMTFDKDRISILNNNYAMFNTLYAVFLGVALVNLLTTFYFAKDSIGREAESLVIAYRLAGGIPSAQEVRPALLNYAISIKDQEFPQMEQGRMSPETQKIMNQIWMQAFNVRPEGANEINISRSFLNEVTELNKYRLNRASKVNDNLHPSVVFVIYIGYLLMLVKMWFTRIDWPVHQFSNEIIVVGITCVVIIVILDLKTPFSGICTVTAEAFEAAVQRMQAIKAGG
ncbi:MAG: hypothetical protein WCJ37_11455 [Syntrophus sp. (in: bacteria)]